MDTSRTIPVSTGADELIPFSDDEEEISITVEGRNLVHEHLVSGWGSIWRGPNCKLFPEDSNKFIRTISTENITEWLVELNRPWLPTVNKNPYLWSQKDCILINEKSGKPSFKLSDVIGCIGIASQVALQVLEKRSVTVTKAGAVYTKFVVADTSGCCQIVLFGDTAVHPVVNVGDILVITICRTASHEQLKQHNTELTTIKQKYLLNLQLRFRIFDFRSAVVIKGMNTARWCCEFYPEDGIRVVHELLNSKTGDFGNDENTQGNDFGVKDIAGVIVFVGPLMRSLMGQDDSRLACFRYIQLVSKPEQTKPCTVKILCDNLNWNRQEDIVPGIMIVLTNVCMVDCAKNVFETLYQTTWYTRVLVNGEVLESYLQFRPRAYRLKLRHIASVQASKRILASPSIQWSVGGFPKWTIKNKSLAFRYANYHKRENYAEMERRQVTQLFVHGYLSAVWIVSAHDETEPKKDLYWRTQTLPNFDWYAETTGFKGQKIETFHPNVEKYAIGYTRSFGQPHQVLMDDERIFLAYEKNLKHYKNTCRQLLMPSTRPHSKEKKLNGYRLLRPKYFMLEIIDPFRKQVVTTMYNNDSFDIMETKLNQMITNNEARNNKLECSKDQGEGNSSRLTKRDLEIRRANMIFAIEVLQQESLGPEKLRNFAVCLMDFTSASKESSENS